MWLFSSGPVGKPSSKLAQSMDQDPADLPGILETTRTRDHRRFAGKLDRKHLSLPQRASLLVFRGLEGISATGPRSGSGPKASPGSLRWRHGESGTPMAQQGTHRLDRRPGPPGEGERGASWCRVRHRCRLPGLEQMLCLTPAVTAATPVVLALILLSALAHDSQQDQAAQQPDSPSPNGRWSGQMRRCDMAKIDGEILIGRSAEEVFDFVADSRNEPSFNLAMTGVELLTPLPIGVGTRFRARMGRAGTHCWWSRPSSTGRTGSARAPPAR